MKFGDFFNIKIKTFSNKGFEQEFKIEKNFENKFNVQWIFITFYFVIILYVQVSEITFRSIEFKKKKHFKQMIFNGLFAFECIGIGLIGGNKHQHQPKLQQHQQH